MNTKWFDVERSSEGKIVVRLYDEIGGWGVSAKGLIDELSAAPDDAEIELRIDSPGGDVMEGYALFNYFSQRKGRVIAIVDGLCASIASVIAMAADEVIMGELSLLMIHNPWAMVTGDSEALREQADLLEKIREQIITAYEAKTGMSREELKDLMDKETYLTPDEAFDLGFCDEVRRAEPKAKGRAISAHVFARAAMVNQGPLVQALGSLVDSILNQRLADSEEAKEKLDALSVRLAAQESLIRKQLEINALQHEEIVKLTDRVAALRAAAGVAPASVVPAVSMSEDTGCDHWANYRALKRAGKYREASKYFEQNKSAMSGTNK